MRLRDLFSFRVRDQGEFKEKIEEEVKRYLKEFIRQKIDEKYSKLEKILTDPIVEEIEVCIWDFGINLEPDIVGRELFFEFRRSEAYRITKRALLKEYPEHVETIDEVLYRELDDYPSNFFDYLEDILKEHGFREVELGRDVDCFIFRKK